MRCVDCSGLMCTHKDPNNSVGLTLTKESPARRARGGVGMKMEEDCGDISPSTLERRCPQGATTAGKKPLWSGQS